MDLGLLLKSMIEMVNEKNMDGREDQLPTPTEEDAIQAVMLISEVAPTQDHLDRLEALRATCPDGEFLEGKLSREGHWVDKMREVKLPRERCRVWYYLLNADKNLDHYKHRINEFTAICDCLGSSEGLQELLSILLAAGNYQNGSTNRGRADGFDLIQ